MLIERISYCTSTV